jgi:hypothetical protein
LAALPFERIKAFASGKETPCLILDLDVVKAKYEELEAKLPYAKIYFAVKATLTTKSWPSSEIWVPASTPSAAMSSINCSLSASRRSG